MVNRGRIVTVLIQPSLLESAVSKKQNRNKVGRPFQFPSALISAAFAVKCALRFAYRQLADFMKDISQKFDIKMPNFRTIWWRIDRMKDDGIKFNATEGKYRVVAIDSTGLRPVNDGEYRKMKYDQRKEWIKLHVAVEVETKEILSLTVTK